MEQEKAKLIYRKTLRKWSPLGGTGAGIEQEGARGNFTGKMETWWGFGLQGYMHLSKFTKYYS